MSISLTGVYDRLIDFSSNRHEETTSVVEIEKRTDVELKIPTKPSSFIKAIDSTIKSFPTYLSDFAQPESQSGSGYFGWFVSVSDDGHVILVSDYLADGNSLTDNGAIWCFEYSGGSWSQKGSTIYGPVASGRLGEDLHLSGDGNTIYAGSPQSAITDLYIYTYNTSTSDWNTAQTISGEWRGQIRSNYDGTIIIVSQPGYSTILNQVGRAVVYEYSGGSWSQKGSDIDGQESSSLLHGVAMTPDGTQIVISERNKGRQKVFTYDTSTSDWVQKGSTLRDFDNNDDARAIDISDDGNTLAVGGYNDDTDGLTNNGSIKIYTYDTDWTLITTISGDQGGDSITYEAVSLSGDGTTVAFSERYGNSSNLARIRVFRNENNVWTEIYTNTINYVGGFTGITCKMSRDKSTIISHYRDTDNSNYRTLYLAHSYNNGYNYYANTDTTTPDSYKSIRLMPSTNPKSGYLDLITDENENFEMNVHGNATINNTKIGPITSSAAFAHKDRFNTTDYALRQNSSGDTVLNAASGRTLHLRNGETSIATITNTHLNVNSIKPLSSQSLRIEEYDSTPNHQLWLGYGGNKWRKIVLEVANANGSTDAQIYFIRSGSWKSWSGISSDSRIKENQELYPPSDSMNIVKTIKVKKYFNTELQQEVKGFIAQEVEAILPEAVETHDLSEAGKESDFKMLDYRRLQVHAFGAIQFLDSIIETQQTQINNLTTQNNLLKSKLNELLSEAGKETIP